MLAASATFSSSAAAHSAGEVWGPLRLLTLAGDLGGLEILHVATDHAVETFGCLGVSFDLGADQLHRVDAHQFDLKKVAGLVEHEVLVEPFDDHVEHDLLFRGQTAVGKDAVTQAVLVAFRRTRAAPGRFCLALVAVPAIHCLFVRFAQSRIDFLPMFVLLCRDAGRETDLASKHAPAGSAVTYRKRRPSVGSDPVFARPR